MNVRRLHHFWRHFRRIKPWYFLVLTVVMVVICAFSLRANNQHMIVLRDAVYQADKDNTDIQDALNKLQAYVTAHMNTTLSAGPNAVYPPIQLKYTYDRLVQAQADAIAAQNTTLYTDAQTYCQQQIPDGFSGRGRIPCIEEYVESHDSSVTPIPDALYKFAFVTPKWSPDLAGWSLVLAVFSGLLFVITLALDFWIKRRVS